MTDSCPSPARCRSPPTSASSTRAEGPTASGSCTRAPSPSTCTCPAAARRSSEPSALLGWSWLIPPYHWHLGARAASPVRAYEYDAAAVRALCEDDPELDHALLTYVVGVIARRLRSARVRLLDLYAPHGAGEVP